MAGLQTEEDEQVGEKNKNIWSTNLFFLRFYSGQVHILLSGYMTFFTKAKNKIKMQLVYFYPIEFFSIFHKSGVNREKERKR